MTKYERFDTFEDAFDVYGTVSGFENHKGDYFDNRSCNRGNLIKAIVDDRLNISYDDDDPEFKIAVNTKVRGIITIKPEFGDETYIGFNEVTIKELNDRRNELENNNNGISIRSVCFTIYMREIENKIEEYRAEQRKAEQRKAEEAAAKTKDFINKFFGF